MYYDPPSGWKYGFPKKVTKGQDIRKLLIESGYPKKDIDFALKYGRWIGSYEEESDEEK